MCFAGWHEEKEDGREAQEPLIDSFGRMCGGKNRRGSKTIRCEMRGGTCGEMKRLAEGRLRWRGAIRPAEKENTLNFNLC